jgi:hypothetical protein
LDLPVPDFSTVCRRQKTLQVQRSYRPSTKSLHLLADSTGVKFLSEGEFKRKKHGAEYRREWRKVHLGIDAQTLEIRAIEVTSNAIGDAPMLPGLLAQVPVEEPIASVSADGAYDTRTCLDAIASRWAQAVIPPRKNASQWKRVSPGFQPSKRGGTVLQALRATPVEGLERVTPAQPGVDQDALIQAPGGAGHGAHVRAPGGGVACPGSAAEPLQPDRPSSNRGRGLRVISPSELGSCRPKIDQCNKAT